MSGMEDTLIVDGGWAGRLLQLTLPSELEGEVNLVGFVDAEPHERRDHPERLAALVRLFDVDRVILASSRGSGEKTRHAAHTLSDLGAKIDIARNPDHGVAAATHANNGEPILTIGLPRATTSRPSRVAKRTIDVVGALLGLLVASPLFAYAAWRINRESACPVFTRRRCLGMGMREFVALDFRTTRPRAKPSHREYLRETMLRKTGEDPAAGIGREQDNWLTPFGRRLKQTGLAELPRLINVLRGDMSLVGPRPCDVHERDVFEPRHFERFLVPAGLTGPLQSARQGEIPYTAGLDLEVAYARTHSLKGDSALLFRMVLRRIGLRAAA
jgi:lipopolysaccharide/colanic/teichoic acid biosynthesis glycosyltransferase